MKQTILYIAVALGVIIPSLASAHSNNPAPAPSAIITQVTLNGGTYGSGHYLQVNPGDPITVTITTDLENKAKWKGTQWGINANTTTPTCTNTKNKHARQVDSGHGSSWYGGDDRDDDRSGFWWFKRHDGHKFDDDHETNNTYQITFTVYAPKTTGLYNANFIPDGKNNCGAPLGPLFQLQGAILVGHDTQAPVIAPHDDVSLVLTSLSATGATVTYTTPTATDDIDTSVAVSCSPASGSFFPVGTTIVSCFAHDSAGNTAMPVSFNVTVSLPPDLTAPVIAPHDNISIQAPDNSGVVGTYTNPIATDDRDGVVSVSCAPASGSVFAVGTTTVDCTASDAAGNISHSSFDVGVAAPVAVVDTEAPVIAAHSDAVVFLQHAADTSATVTYTTPTATDNVDGIDPVSCTPASGSTFAIGSTTVTCSATDTAGNTAQSTFVVGVYAFVPQPVTIASQPDESYMCLPDESNGWRACYTGGDAFNSLTIPLGQGSGLQAGALAGVTVALDPNFASIIAPSNPFRIYISCFTDAAYTSPCTDWVASDINHDNSYVVQDALTTTDNKHWTANFAVEQNFGGSSPVVFNPSYYYQLKIQDTVGWPAFGQDPSVVSNPQPYWVISGITQ
jgi:hypothetical protein